MSDQPAERDALARLEAWLREDECRRCIPIWCSGENTWIVRLEGEAPRNRWPYIFGCSDPQYSGKPDEDPCTLYLGDGATLGACILAAMEKWASLNAKQKESPA